MPAVASPPPASRSTITTLAPYLPKPSADARPMPLAPPVMSATLFWKFILCASSGRQPRRLPGHHLPASIALGVDIGEAHAKGVRRAVRHDLDLGNPGQNDRIAQ